MLHVYPDQMLQKSFHQGLHYLVTLCILVTHKWLINAYFAAFHQGLHYVKKYIDLYLEIITGTPASNLGYLAPPPGQFFMGAKLFIGTPWMGNEGVLKKILVWAMWNCMVSMPTHSGFEKGGLPINLLISQLLLILDY